LDKLGVKAEADVRVLGVRDAEFLRALEQRTANVLPRVGTPCDLIFYGAETIAALAKLASLRRQIREDGAIWVISRKGRAATIRHADVIAAAKVAGLIDNKVVSFSPTHTSLRLVVPLALRKPDP
jgi:hypothetical protein